MTCDPKKRDSTWLMIEPGCYIDPDGCGHVFPDEVIAELSRRHPDIGFAYTREDYDLVVETVVAMLRGQFVEVKFIRHEREVS